jgi:molybdopterin-guanine dinucleotide biosynthesis protein A
MNRDKALLEWQGRPLIEHALDKLRRLGVHTRILGARPDLERFAPIIRDNFPGQGPLGGIEAALSVTESELNLFLPVDLPFLPCEFLGWMVSRAGLTEAAATIPRIGDRLQPLCAIYHRRLLSGIRTSLQRRDAKVTRAIEQSARDAGIRSDYFDVERVDAAMDDPAVWPRHPSMRRWFQNLNTPDDLAQSILEQTPRIH